MSIVYCLADSNLCSIFLFIRIYTEEQPGDAAIMLFMKDLREKDSGSYTCEGVYANNEKMVTQVTISTFSECTTWDFK